jgi:N12 class adenine-specific DNA methylase
MSAERVATIVKMLETLPDAVQERACDRLREYIEDLRDEMQWDVFYANNRDALVKAARRAPVSTTRATAPRAAATCGVSAAAIRIDRESRLDSQESGSTDYSAGGPAERLDTSGMPIRFCRPSGT